VATKGPRTGPFIGGLIAGFVVGGLILTPIAFFTAAFAFNKLNASYVFVSIYVLAFVLGGFAFWRIRVGLDFLSGFLTGVAAGLLGLAGLCNIVIGGLGNTH
jgi:hypothetical protein